MGTVEHDAINNYLDDPIDGSFLDVSNTEIVHSILMRDMLQELLKTSSFVRNLKHLSHYYNFKCVPCHLHFDDEETLINKHNEKCHKNRYLCTICGKDFKTNISIRCRKENKNPKLPF